MKDTTAKGKKKSAAKKKSNKAPAKKLKRSKKNKAKSVAVKKVKGSARAKSKSVAKKNVRKPVESKPKSVAGKKTRESIEAKSKSPVNAPPVEEKITHGEDLHLIPVEGEIHPIDTDESHRLENIFQNREEVSLQQENQKIKNALGAPKNLKKNFRVPPHR